ncbi:MAG: hypothetical protein WBP26_00490 [Candidatus Saccharimonadales bacterium]
MSHDETEKPQEPNQPPAAETPKPEAPAVVQQPVQATTPVAVQPPTIQYVKAPEELNGIAGWLVGWLIYAALWAVGAVSAFFSTLAGAADSLYTESDAFKAVVLIFMPLIAISAIGAILLIAQRKRLGKTLSLALIASTGLYALFSVLLTSGNDAASIAATITAIAIICPLQAMYFFQSARVKQTLIQ